MLLVKTHYIINIIFKYLIFHKICLQVLPKPMTPLNHDLIFEPLNIGMGKIISNKVNIYKLGIGITHCRAMLNMYNVRIYIIK